MKTIARFFLTFSLLLSLALFPALTVSAQGGQVITITQVDTSKFPQVTVYISVTDAAGEPVSVSPSSLQVFEGGAQMMPAAISAQGEIGPLTTLLAIDNSGSMYNSGKIVGAQNAAKAYVEQMRPQDQAGLISFNTQVTIVQPVTTDRAALIAAIDSLVPDKDTAMFDALVAGVNTLAPIEGRKTIVLLSDGLDNMSLSGLEDVITAIGPAGLSISTIGLGDPEQSGTNNGLDEPALSELSTRAGGVYRFASGPDALVDIYEQFGRALQGEFSFTYISPSTLRDGINRGLTVKISDSAVSSQYNPGGVLPEVSGSSLPLFGGILAGLLLLLVLPFLFRGRGAKMANASAQASPAKGRVKLK